MSNENLDINDVIANPSKHGFEWGFGPLHHNGMKIADAAPHIVHVNLELMRATFGDQYFLDSANSRSARVRDQTIRADIFADRSLAKDSAAMKLIVMERALGVKARKSRVTIVEKIVNVPTYLADDGTEFTSKADCMAHNVDLKLAARDEDNSTVID